MMMNLSRVLVVVQAAVVLGFGSVSARDQVASGKLEAARNSARTWHTFLAKPSTEAAYITNFEFVQACPDQMTWHVALRFETLAGSKRLPPGVPDHLFFLVGQRESRFEVVNVGTTAFAGCPGRTPPSSGPDRLPK